MIRTIETERTEMCSCPDCGRGFINPGYNRKSVYCCGAYHRCFRRVVVRRVMEDGRDALGRFSIPAYLISAQTIK